MADEPQAKGEIANQPAASSAAAAAVAAAASAAATKEAQPAAQTTKTVAEKAAETVVKPGEAAAAAAKPATEKQAEVAKTPAELAAAEQAAATAAAAQKVADEAAAKQAATEKAAAEAAAAAKVPEKYELYVAPDKPVNPAAVEAITPVLKKAGLTAGVAQELVNSFMSYQAAEIPRVAARHLETVKTDPTIGGDNFGRTMARVNAALTEFSTPEDRAAMEAAGLQNFPPYVRWMERVGRWLDPEQQTDPGPQVRAKGTREQKLYGGGDLVRAGRAQ